LEQQMFPYKHIPDGTPDATTIRRKSRMSQTRTAALLSVGLASVGLLAWTLSGVPSVDATKILIHVPFEFRVAQTILPAGEYTLEQTTSRAVRIRSSGGERVVGLEGLVKRTGPGSQARIIFTQDHGKYVLSEVEWPADGNPARRLRTKSDTDRLPELTSVFKG
jgi:hypothetical protein